VFTHFEPPAGKQDQRDDADHDRLLTTNERRAVDSLSDGTGSTMDQARCRVKKAVRGPSAGTWPVPGYLAHPGNGRSVVRRTRRRSRLRAINL
jgi:hypothetical protein